MKLLNNDGHLQTLWAYLAVIPFVFLNQGLGMVKDALQWPVYLDTIGTLLSAALGGLVPCLLVGLLSNGLYEVYEKLPGYEWPFALVNMTSALITWTMLKNGLLKTLTGYLWLLLALIVANSLLGAYLATVLFGGIIGGVTDIIVQSLRITGESIFTSAFLGRLFINLVDKGIAVLVLVVVQQLVRNYLAKRSN
jgi:energy-coupling factor transport system substrate-specific component